MEDSETRERGQQTRHRRAGTQTETGSRTQDDDTRQVYKIKQEVAKTQFKTEYIYSPWLKLKSSDMSLSLSYFYMFILFTSHPHTQCLRPLEHFSDAFQSDDF